MQKFILIFSLICACYNSQAQIFYNKAIDINSNHNGMVNIIKLNNDSVLMVGFNLENSGRSKSFCYINAHNGDTIFSFKHVRDSLDTYNGQVDAVIRNSKIYSSGTYSESGKGYAHFLKFTIDGNLILDTLYNNQGTTQFNCILPVDDGNFLIVGNKETISGNLDAWLVKMDQNGNILWEKSFNYSWYDQAILIVPHQGNFLISAGKMVSGEVDTWLLCVDPDGNLIWEKTFGGPFYDGGAARSLSNGEIHVSGYREYSQDQREAFIIRLTENGDLLWDKSLFKMNTPYAPSNLSIFEQLADSSIIVGGTTYEHDSPLDFPVARIYKMSQDGDSIWTRILKLRNNDNYLCDIEELENGDILMAGYIFPDSPDNTEDGWLLRTNCLGFFEHPTDSITFTDNNSTVTALNLSTFYEYTVIDWGDNEKDTLFSGKELVKTHQYQFPGNYTITSTTVACNDTVSHQYPYQVTPPTFSDLDLSIFPNPNDGLFELWLNSTDTFNIKVIDLNGKTIKNISNITLINGYQMDLKDVATAVYFVQATSTNQNVQARIIVSK